MNRAFRTFTLSSCITLLIGCSAAMVPATNDPALKLRQATDLLEQQDRPLPAERLILDAIEIYRTENNERGLAEAYRKYGIFFGSYTVKKWESIYRKDGFLDKTTTFDQRLDKSIEYLAKSRALFAKTKAHDLLSNVDLHTAWAYEGKGTLDSACKALDSSLENNQIFTKENPNTKIRLTGFASYAEFIASEKKRMRCL